MATEICLGDVNVGVLVPDKINIWLRQVFTYNVPPRVTGFIMPLQATVS